LQSAIRATTNRPIDLNGKAVDPFEDPPFYQDYSADYRRKMAPAWFDVEGRLLESSKAPWICSAPTKKKVKWRYCGPCHKRTPLPRVAPVGTFCDQPAILRKVTSPFDQQKLSLANLTGNYTRANPHSSIFAHTAGQYNALHKYPYQYMGQLGLIVSRFQVAEIAAPSNTMKKAYRFMFNECQNVLLKDHHMMWSTLFNYFSSSKGVVVQGDTVIDSHGNCVTNTMHHEEEVYMMPEEDLAYGNDWDQFERLLGTDVAGTEFLKVWDVTRSVRKVHHLKYSDPQLEAKIFTTKYPFGVGSYDQTSKLGMHAYVQNRLLGFCDRWRTDSRFRFFMFQRDIKCRLMYCASNRHVQPEKLVTPLTPSVVDQANRSSIQDDNLAQRYGTSVPAGIVNSEPYWKARQADLACVEKQNRDADYMITITQNDMAPELLAAIRNGPGAGASVDDMVQYLIENVDGCDVADIAATRAAGESMMRRLERSRKKSANKRKRESVGHPVMTTLCFFKRYHAFVAALKTDGLLRQTEDYWARIEFQNRGALHVHILLWLRHSEERRHSLLERSCKIDAELARPCGQTATDAELLCAWHVRNAQRTQVTDQSMSCIDRLCHR
jgi:hypothetical protein